jgi:hypothetical protein
MSLSSKVGRSSRLSWIRRRRRGHRRVKSLLMCLSLSGSVGSSSHLSWIHCRRRGPSYVLWKMNPILQSTINLQITNMYNSKIKEYQKYD